MLGRRSSIAPLPARCAASPPDGRAGAWPPFHPFVHPAQEAAEVEADDAQDTRLAGVIINE